MRTAQRARHARAVLSQCEELLTPIHKDLDIAVALFADHEAESQRGYIAEEHVAALKDALTAIVAAKAKMRASMRG